MLRCLELAAKGLGKTRSNPLVGSVIVYEDRIIGEGYHSEFGGPHAEVSAIESVNEPALLKKSTLFVNLEPCCHFGKTPPCVHLIKEYGIPCVIIGTIDPNPLVTGKGIDFLKQNGIRVITNILEDECRYLNRRFFTFHKKKRPYIILKWAQSPDGFIDSRINHENKGERSLISCKKSQILVHKWRSEEMGVMVGTNTANMDNPSLTVRYWKGNNPLRISMERNSSLYENLNLLKDGVKTLIYTSKPKENTGFTEYIRPKNEHLTMNFILDDLQKRGIISLIAEGGATLLNNLIRENLWDEARIFTGKTNLYRGLKAPVLNKSGQKFMFIDEDVLELLFNKFD